MGACNSAPSSSDVDRRRRDLSVLRSWKFLLESLSPEERNTVQLHGHPKCSGVAFSVWRSATSLEDRSECLNHVSEFDTDWMVLVSACGTPLYLSCLMTGPEADSRCSSKKQVFLVDDYTKRNFDDKNLTAKLSGPQRTALDTVIFYNDDLHKSIGKTKHSHMHDNHWSKVPRWCQSCKESFESALNDEKDLATSGMSDPTGYLSPSTQTRRHFSPSPRPSHHELHDHGHTPIVVLPVRLDSSGGVMSPGSGAHSMPSSRQPSMKHPAGHLLPLPAHSRPQSRAGSRSASRNNSPSRSRSRSRSKSISRGRALPHAQSHPPHLQSLRSTHLSAASHSHQLPLLPILPTHEHASSFPGVISHAGIHLDIPAHPTHRPTPSASRVGYTEWIDGVFLVTKWGCSELAALNIAAHVVSGDGTPTAGDWLQLSNHSRRSHSCTRHIARISHRFTPGGRSTWHNSRVATHVRSRSMSRGEAKRDHGSMLSRYGTQLNQAQNCEYAVCEWMCDQIDRVQHVPLSSCMCQSHYIHVRDFVEIE
jgi:hypothetical protein